MKTFFYPRLAASGMIKNKRMYLPFILTCTGMVMMFYIIIYLAVSSVLDNLIGAESLRQMFALGSWVIAVFAAIFLFYTNSFLIKRRKKEFGLYNILGMGKRNIARILFWETVITAVVSVIAGLAAGIAFSKFAELGMVNIMHGEVSYDLSVSFVAVLRSVEVFGVIFLLLLCNSIRQVRFSSAVSLLRSENAGEKPPKGNWLFGICGALLLLGAYYISATIENPLAALMVFFVAVLMVIVGTYLFMISGSVIFCRLLQKDKGYYYKPNHFVSVSSMVYRMKRNGAGLASICILATMVLVMMASTTCLYFGEEDAVLTRYPRDINLEFQFDDLSDFLDEHTEILKNGVYEELKAKNVLLRNDYRYRVATFYGVVDGNTVDVDPTGISDTDFMNSAYVFRFIPLADYNELMGADETLADGEALLYSHRTNYNADAVSFKNGETFRIKKKLDTLTGGSETAMDMISTITLVVPELESSLRRLDGIANFNGDSLLQKKWICSFDTGMDPEEQIALYQDLTETLRRDPSSSVKLGYKSVYISSQEFEKNDFYGLFGALFYLGIILSLAFTVAAVLIIYYKQISEGYEDQARFLIMQKVGMTKPEIRASINSQLLTVFFLPLLLAVLHVTFAFPIIRKILLMFNLNNARLFASTTLLTVAVFALFYTAVYRLTSNAYYKIVSGLGGER